MARLVCPCKGCEKRAVGCHGTCSEYKTWSVNQRKNTLENKKALPPRLSRCSFLGSSPKPGTHISSRRW